MSYKKEKAIAHINRVEHYLQWERSVEVEYDRDGTNEYRPNLSRIEINSRQNYTSRLHTLLHEAGHVILRKGRVQQFEPKKSFKKGFPHMKTGGSDVRGNWDHRIDVLREEVLAWEKGEELAQYLSIKLNKKVWSRHRNEALKTYVKWI